MSQNRAVKSALESMMFVWGQLLSVSDAAEILNIPKKEAAEYLDEMEREYREEKRGIRIRKVNGSYQLVTDSENADYIERLCRPVKKRRLSQSALEVLAIVAYRQPVTRGEIDAIRGVKSDRVLEGLVHKELIMEKGRSEAIGRPILYGTTDTFLKTFGYSTLKELPDIGDFTDDTDLAMEERLETDGVIINQISLAEVSSEESE